MNISISLTELLGFITGAACVWLLVKQSIWNWPVSIANFIFSIVLFYNSRLYGDMSLQFVFIIVSLYGWWNWVYGAKDRAELPVTRVASAAMMVLLAATVVMTLVFHYVLQTYTPSTTPWPDAVTTALSLTAIYMQSRKWIENWVVWIIADVLYIGLYIYKHLNLYAVLYVLFMGMCVAGYVEWRKSLGAAAAPETVIA